MYRSTLFVAVWMILTISGWAQHSGHTAEESAAPGAHPAAAGGGPVLTVREAVKETQVAYREVERRARRSDGHTFRDAMARYEGSIDALLRSVDSLAERNAVKDLDVAIRALERQYQQLERLAAASPAETTDALQRLVDAVALARDEALAQRAALGRAEASAHDSHDSAAHGSSGGHGCGGGLKKILRRIL